MSAAHEMATKAGNPPWATRLVGRRAPSWAARLLLAIVLGLLGSVAHARAPGVASAPENSPLGLARNSGAALVGAERSQAPESPLESAFGYGQLASDNAYATRGFPRDFATRNTINRSAQYGSQGEARALARQKVGSDPVQVEPGKLRSQDGRWQYRGKPEDLRGHGPSDSPHIHLERLDPKTGEVLENWHLRW
jgi:hypothetical protein